MAVICKIRVLEHYNAFFYRERIKYFRYALKQKGAMLAKGAAIALQFDALIGTGLYDNLAVHANNMAMKIAGGIKQAGYSFLHPAETNQIFPGFPAKISHELHKYYDFYDWRITDDLVYARIVTSWATPESVADEFISDLNRIAAVLS